MKRREFITLLGGAAARGRWRRGRSSPSAMRRIGVLMNLAADDPEDRPASRRSCRDCSNWAGPTAATCGSISAGRAGDADAFADTRRNWSRSRRTSSWPSAAQTVGPLLQATRTVPIVFVNVVDPVGAGFVASLARPGGNATGFTSFEYGMSGKWLELLKADRAARDASGGPSGSRHSLRDRPVRRHPGRGAVVRSGGEPGRRARRRRDRARRSRPSRAARMAA